MNRPFCVSAPGKVILHGEHAVVYGKTALASSLNLRTRLKLSQTNIKDTASFSLPDIGLELKWRLDDLNEIFVEFLKREASLDIGPPTVSQFDKMKEFTKISEEGSAKDLAVLAVLYLYVAILGSNNVIRFPAIEVQITSELPTGAGLGSSAAFSVCLSAAFLTQAGSIIPVEGSNSWKQEDLDLINQWAFEAERIIHGNPSGIDNAVSTYGGALRYQGKQIKSLENVPLLRIILINTKIPRSTKVLVAGVRVKFDEYPAIIGPVFDSIEEIAQKCQLVLESLVIDKTLKEVADKQTSVESHPIREQGVIHPDQSPYSSLEELIDMNQKFLEILGVSHPSLEKLCTLTSQHGLHSKLTGAGGGGCTLTLIRPDTVPDTVIQVKEDVAKLGFDLWETSIGGIGVAFHADV
ncbi:mevalonate kinase-like [Asterias rubens]|uniref:mevalonate kinase-like n=1 Tax=Asterias rubens TaxID=7604 RepID=UPI0014552E5E|nr:mevalonate kinase-like [Asterias rubens]